MDSNLFTSDVRDILYPLKSLKTVKICLEIGDGGNVSRCLPKRITYGLQSTSQIISSAASSPSLSSIVINVLVQVTDTRVASVIGGTPYLDIEQMKWEVVDERIDQLRGFATYFPANRQISFQRTLRWNVLSARRYQYTSLRPSSSCMCSLVTSRNGV
jgi:hypothetical protein